MMIKIMMDNDPGVFESESSRETVRKLFESAGAEKKYLRQFSTTRWKNDQECKVGHTELFENACTVIMINATNKHCGMLKHSLTHPRIQPQS